MPGIMRRVRISMSQTYSETGFAEIDGTRLYYEVSGDGHPLLLLHEGIADSRMWDEQVPAFAEHYRVIRYDIPGFGRSEIPARAFAEYELTAKLLRFLGVAQAYVIGASFGGRIALEFTLTHPEMVDALVLLAPSVGGETPSAEVQRFNAEEEEALERGDLAAATEINLRMWVDGPRRTPEQVNPLVRERVRAMQMHAFTIPIPEGADEIWLEPPAITRLKEIRVPTLLMVGDYDIEPKLKLVERLEREIPGAHRVVIPGAAHATNMEQPEAFNQAVLEFLQQ